MPNPAPQRSEFLQPAAILVTIVVLIAPSERPSAFQTPADTLASHIDATVSPGQDFFQYANGEWLKRNPIPEDQSRWGIWNEAVYPQIREISETAAARTAAPGTAEQLIGAVWATGMDEATINAQGLKPLQPELDQIDRIRSIGDVLDFVAVMHRRRMIIDDVFTKPAVLFAADVRPDEQQSDRLIYNLAPGGTSIGQPAYSATDPQRAKARDALHEYIFKTFLRLGRDSGKATTSADAVFNIETRLAAGPSGGGSSRMALADLKQAAPTVDWDRYFHRLGVNSINSINVRTPKFLGTLDALLRAAPLEDWQDYLRFWLIRLNAPFLDDGTYGEFFAFKSAVTGRTAPRPRWKRVVFQEKNWFGLPLSKLFAATYFPKDTLGRYEAVGEAIREAFRRRIEQADWLSDSTKRNALLKLDRLRITVGYSETRIDYSTMGLQRDSYVLNMIRSAEWFHDQEIKGLNAPGAATIDLEELHMGVDDDPEYVPTANEVRAQRPVTAPGMSEQELDDALVYAASAFGHEISHALDSEGRRYDASGNMVDWWTAPDAATFDRRAQGLIDEYSDFTPIDGLHIDGKSSLRENMANLVGLRIALDAFKTTDQFKKNQAVAGFTPLQRFFLAYAYSHMGQERKEMLAGMLKGAYAPEREQVNGVVVNIPEFYEAFGVKAGDPMYRPPSARVTIW